MGDTQHNSDEPRGTSWAEDWAAAEEKADAQGTDNSGGEGDEENNEGGSPEHQSEHDSGGDEEGDGSGSEAQLGEESLRDESDGGGQRDVPREGRVRRDGEEELLEAKPRAERLKALREEAKALGLEYEGNSVTVADRAKLREEKRALKGKLASDRQAFEQEADETLKRLEARSAKATRLEAAIEANDLDGVAQAMGQQSWNHLSEQALKRQLNPEHKELMKLRRQATEAEAAKEQRQKDELANGEAAQRQEARSKYRQEVTTALHQSKKYKAFADDPLFVAGVLKHQEDNWDGEETLSVDEASALALKEARFIYDKLHEKFGGQAASQPENASASGTSAEKRGRKSPPKTVSQAEVADASGTDNSGDFDEDAWLKKHMPLIKNSVPQS